jgi:hypothetical protein
VLAKLTFDSRMPQIKGGSGSVVVLRICMILELRPTKRRTFVCAVIHAGGGIPMVHHLEVCCGH